MSDRAFTFEITIPSADGSIRFVFGNRDNRDHIASFIRAKGLASYEAPTPSVFVHLARQVAGLVLDVGANTGVFALLAAAANPQLCVCAFEPLESVRELLRENLAYNPGLASRIAVEPFALSRANGSFPFFETINDQGLITTSSSLELEHAQQVGDFRSSSVVTRTLDGWAEALGRAAIELVKIDVEGHEDAVIEGAQKTIDRHRPFIILEILGPSRVEAFDRMLIESDYLDIALTPSALRHCLRVRFHADAWNHLLCPAEKAQRVLALCRELDLRLEFA
ncbi:MAG: FkbM family methyltransferase [Alphaproteobacteria bacterium]|nr:FkbM family methyltransferase [Alphaproteobacteria bacterium]